MTKPTVIARSAVSRSPERSEGGVAIRQRRERVSSDYAHEPLSVGIGRPPPQIATPASGGLAMTKEMVSSPARGEDRMRY